MCLRDCSEYRGPTGPVFELCVRSDTSPFEVKLILMCKTCNLHIFYLTHLTHWCLTRRVSSYTLKGLTHWYLTLRLPTYTLWVLTHWCLTHYLPTYTLRVLTHGQLTHHYPTYTLSFVFDWKLNLSTYTFLLNLMNIVKHVPSGGKLKSGAEIAK